LAGSRQPGPTSDSGRPSSLEDGTLARTWAAGGGVVGSTAHVALEPDTRVGREHGAIQETLIDATGVLKSSRVTPAIANTIERGKMAAVRGIIVHQTGGASARSTLDSYKRADANGAHFLVDKDGTIYQTASLFQRTWHVGKLKARCLLENNCEPAEITAYKKFDPTGMHQRESKKSVPQRFPSNEDSVGIELVGQALPDPQNPTGDPIYEAVTEAQNLSLQWLIGELTRLLAVPLTEIFRHPVVSRKNPTEAQSASW
jgi:N-acetyl-anhydromuramyl-L-alanine amidase AmpD